MALPKVFQVSNPFQKPTTTTTTTTKTSTSSGIAKGGFYVPSKTGSGGTYYVGGQGYSVATNPNTTTFSSGTSSGGHSSSGGGSSSSSTTTTPTPTTTTTPAQTSNIQAIADQQKIASQIEQLKQEQTKAELVKKLTVGSTLPTSSYNDFFDPVKVKKREIEKLEQQRMSVESRITKEQIDKAVKTGKVSAGTGLYATAFVGTENIQKAYAQASAVQEAKLLADAKASYDAEKTQILQVYQNEFNRIQDQVNNGYDINKATKEWEKISKDLEKIDKDTVDKANRNIKEKYDSWNKGWQETQGVQLTGELTRDLTRTRIQYQKDDITNIKKQGTELLKSAVSGAEVGGALTIASKSGIFNWAGKFVPAVIKTTAKKVTGLGIFAGLTGVNMLASLSSRGGQEKIYLDQGFTKKEAFELARTESNYQFAKTEAELGAFFAGAELAGGVINYAGNMFKGNTLSLKEKEIIEGVLRANPNAVKMQSVYGKVTEQNIKTWAKENPNGEARVIRNGVEVSVPISQIQKGEIIRYYRLGIDSVGLTKLEIKALEKVVKPSNINARSIVQTSIVDGNVIQITRGEISAPRIKLNEQGISLLNARINSQGSYTGLQFKQIYELNPPTQSLFQRYANRIMPNYPKKVELKSESLFAVEGSGKVSYTDGIFKYRAEAGSGTEKRLLQKNMKNGLWDTSPIKQPVTSTKGGYVSKQNKLRIDAVEEESLLSIRKTSRFKDIAGKETSTNLVEFNKVIAKKLPKRTTSLFEKPKMERPTSYVKETKEEPSLFTAEPEKPLGYGIPRATGGTGVVGLLESPEISSIQRARLTSQTFEIPQGNLFDLKEAVQGTAGKMVRGTKTTTIFGPMEMEINKRQSLFMDNELENRPTKVSLVEPTTINRQALMPINNVAQGSRVGLLNIPAVTTQEIQAQKIDQIQLFKPKQFIPFKPINPNMKFETPVVPPLFLGRVEVGGGQKREPTGTTSRFSAKYNPSLSSVLLGRKKIKLTKEEYKLLSKKKFSGLEDRPLFEIVK